MKVNLRKIVAITMMFMMIVVSTPMASTADVSVVPVNEQNETGITPRLTYIVDAMTDFSISGGTATVDCWVKGNISTATKAKVIVELQLESGADNWIAYKTWVDTQNSYRAAVKDRKSVTAGNTYRVKATYTVWEGSASENLIVFSDEITA